MMPTMLDVVVLSLEKVHFRGKASSLICPGEQGTFEIAPFHRPFTSCLLSGDLRVGDRVFPIRRGVVRVEKNAVLCIVDPF